MERMPEFRLLRPTNLVEAAALLAAAPEARLLAGGTDLVPNLRRGIEQPALLIDLGAVQGFDAIGSADGGALQMGAGVTLARLAAGAAEARGAGAGGSASGSADGAAGTADPGRPSAPARPGPFAAIGEAARAAAGPGHRSVATLGGNLCLDTRCVFYNQSEWWRAANGYCLKRGGDTCHVAPQGRHCHAAFSGDLAPALIALDAEVDLVSAKSMRRLPLAGIYRDDGAAPLVLARNELLARVRIPAAAPGSVSGYRKARVRGAMDFPLAGVACALRLEGGAVVALRIALTGTNPQPLLLQGTEALLGRPLDETGLAQIGKLVQKQVGPMRTTVTPAQHRRLVAAALAQRLLRELAASAATAEP